MHVCMCVCFPCLTLATSSYMSNCVHAWYYVYNSTASQQLFHSFFFFLLSSPTSLSSSSRRRRRLSPISFMKGEFVVLLHIRGSYNSSERIEQQQQQLQLKIPSEKTPNIYTLRYMVQGQLESESRSSYYYYNFTY